MIPSNSKGLVKLIFDKNREVTSLPKYFTLIAVLHALTLLIPESFWSDIGFDAFNYVNRFPEFIDYYVTTAHFHNAMFIFWITSPFVLIANTFLFARKTNTVEYKSYLARREKILKEQNKPWRYDVFFGCIVLFTGYIWATFIHLAEPTAWRSFVPTQNRFVMLWIHGGLISLAFPLMLTLIITEIRILLTKKGTNNGL